ARRQNWKFLHAALSPWREWLLLPEPTPNSDPYPHAVRGRHDEAAGARGHRAPRRRRSREHEPRHARHVLDRRLAGPLARDARVDGRELRGLLREEGAEARLMLPACRARFRFAIESVPASDSRTGR